MKIKTKCVRCGKTIEGTGPYCTACDDSASERKEHKGASTPSRTLLPLLVLVLLVGAAVVYLLQQDIHSDSTTALQTTYPPSQQDSQAAQETAQSQDLQDAFHNGDDEQKSEDGGGGRDKQVEGQAHIASADNEDNAENGPQPARDADQLTTAEHSQMTPDSQASGAASESPEGNEDAAGETDAALSGLSDDPSWEDSLDKAAATPEDTEEISTDPESAPEVAPEVAPEAVNVEDSSELNATVTHAEEGLQQTAADEADAELQTQTAVAESSDAGASIWIYYADDPGKDERYRELLQQGGMDAVAAKGEWKTKYPVNYIFYRSENKEGLQQLVTLIDNLDFKAFHHLDSATSPRLRGHFADNPQLEFLLILQ